MAQNHNITVFVAGSGDRTYKYGGWAVVVKNITLDEITEVYGDDTEATERRMILTAIASGLKTVFQKYGENNYIDLISPSRYVKRAIGSWKNKAPYGTPGWIHGWAKRDWKKANNYTVFNASLWEEIYNGICKQHTIRITRSESIRSSAFLERCQYLADCARNHNIPTPHNYNAHPNLFELIDKDGSFKFRDLIKSKQGWKTLITGLKRLAAGLDMSLISIHDIEELEQTVELLKLRYKAANGKSENL